MISDLFFIKLTGKQVMTVHVKLEPERRPCGDAKITKPKFPVDKIEVVMKALTLVKFQKSLSGCFIMPGLISIAAFHSRENMDETFFLPGFSNDLLDAVVFTESVKFSDEFNFDMVLLSDFFCILTNLFRKGLVFEVGVIYFVITALTQGKSGSGTAWIALAFMAASVIGNAVTSAFSKVQQTHAGYFMAANERIKIGNLLKGVPMGFFNENSLGEVTGVCTTVLGNIETMVPMVLVNIMGGLIGTLVFTAMIIIFEWRVGLIALAGIVVYFFVVSAMEKKSAAIAPNAQKSQTAQRAYKIQSFVIK